VILFPGFEGKKKEEQLTLLLSAPVSVGRLVGARLLTDSARSRLAKEIRARQD